MNPVFAVQAAFSVLVVVICTCLAGLVIYSVWVAIHEVNKRHSLKHNLSIIGVDWGAGQAEGAEGRAEADCKACWCNSCAKLEYCGRGRRDVKIGKLRPLPCEDCHEGMRFKPMEEPCCPYYENVDGRSIK